MLEKLLQQFKLTTTGGCQACGGIKGKSGAKKTGAKKTGAKKTGAKKTGAKKTVK